MWQDNNSNNNNIHRRLPPVVSIGQQGENTTLYGSIINQKDDDELNDFCKVREKSLEDNSCSDTASMSHRESFATNTPPPISPSWSSTPSNSSRPIITLPPKQKSWCRRCKFSFTQFAFSIGSLCATASALLDLKKALIWGDDDCEGSGSKELDSGDDDDDDDGAGSGDYDVDYYDDAYGKAPLEVWNLSKNLLVASTIFYLIDSFVQSNYGRRLLFQEDYELERMPFPAIFGIAAFFDLLSSILEDDYMPYLAWYNEVICVTLFLLSSLLTIYINYTTFEMYHGKQYYYYNENHLAMFGDAFFLAGCIIDCTVAFYDYPNRYCAAGWTFVASCSVASAGMWFIDSILYSFAAGVDEDESEIDDDESNKDNDDDDDDDITNSSRRTSYASMDVVAGEGQDKEAMEYKKDHCLLENHHQQQMEETAYLLQAWDRLQ